MELRYLGFSQLQNERAYRFDVTEAGHATRQLIVTVDLGLFRVHQVGIQEGPDLCARKLAADLEGCAEGTHTMAGSHELTNEDLRAYASARDGEEARKAGSRKGGVRRSKARGPFFAAIDTMAQIAIIKARCALPR
jgi:hypothetical protein